MPFGGQPPHCFLNQRIVVDLGDITELERLSFGKSRPCSGSGGKMLTSRVGRCRV